MTDLLTVREIYDTVQEHREHVRAAALAHKEACAYLPRALIEYERAFNQAFMTAKGDGGTDGQAKALATLQSLTERERLEELKQRKSASGSALHTWQEVMRTHQAAFNALNRELKFAQAGL